MEKQEKISGQEQAAIEQKAQQLLEEKDSESRTRTYTGPMERVLVVLLFAWAVWYCSFP